MCDYLTDEKDDNRTKDWCRAHSNREKKNTDDTGDHFDWAELHRVIMPARAA
jgi:hypothetical protein